MKHNKAGCLVIHGFGGSIHEVEPLAEHLVEKGYEASCPQLKGHTGQRQDMKKATYEDWIDSAEQELLGLKDKTDEIVIIGFSMGGLIAVNLACKYNIKAIITINTPIYYWDLKRVLFNLMEDLRNKNAHNFKRYMRANENSPIAAMYNFQLLLNKTKAKICKVDCPALILQAKDDDTVRKSSVDYIYESLSSEHKEIKFYNNGGHQILRSQSADKVISDVTDFLDSLRN